MRRSAVSRLVLAGLLAGLAAPGVSAQAPAARAGAARMPNILFVLIDDMGYGDLSVTGNRDVATPNIDRLAADGLLMTQFYDAAPICSASRAGFFTGRFPARNRFVNFIDNRAHNAETGQADWLELGVPNLARALHDRGYATGHFGKWHMGGGRDVGDAPLLTRYGFDESYTQFEGLGPRVLTTNMNQNFTRQSAALKQGPIDYLERAKVTARYVDKTVDFIDRHKNKPWFVQLWPDDIHGAWVPSEEQREASGNVGRDEPQKKYFAVLVALDKEIGRLVEHLRSTGELDDTLIVLTSDNGPSQTRAMYRNGHQPPGSAGIFRGRKSSLYEGGMRQPLIVRWPGHVPAGRRDDRTVAQGVDLYPTLAAITGAAPPTAPDGIDLSRAWMGTPIASRPDLYWTFGAYGPWNASPRPGKPSDVSPTFAMRSGKWKLLADGKGDGAELYDLDADPREAANLAAREPATTRAMTAKLVAWQKSLPLRPSYAQPTAAPEPQGSGSGQ